MQVFFKSHKKPLIFLGLASSSLALYLFFSGFRKNSKKSAAILEKPYNLLPKSRILAYFRDFKVEILSILYDTIDLRLDLCETYSKNHEDLPSNEQLRQKIFPQMLSQIKRKEAFLLRKHGISQQDLEASFSAVFSQDCEIMQLKQEIDKSLENALNGLSPSLEISQEALLGFSAEMCYAITLEIMTKSLIKIRSLYLELKGEGIQDFTLGNLEVIRRSQALNLKKFKEDLLRERGFQEIWGHPVEIYTKLMRKYQEDSKEFSEKVAEIEINYQKVMEVLSRNPEEIEENAIFNTFFKENL